MSSLALYAFSHSEVLLFFGVFLVFLFYLFFFVLWFHLRKPSELFAVLVILLTRVFQDKPFAISTHIYLVLATTSRISPCSVYMYVVGRGERDLVMCITWHLLGLNCISHLLSHSWRMSWSACNRSESANLIMAR